MARISESFQILKFCGAILLAEKQLLILPLISGIVISIFFLILLFSMLLVFPLSNEVSVFVEILKYLFLFSLYFITSFVATFSNFAFVSIVYDKLIGGQGRFNVGLRMAKQHSKQILIWSFISATLGVLARLSREKLGMIGRVISSTYNLTWPLATYFVVPTILSGNLSVKDSVQESASLFHRTWKENAVGQLSSGLILLFFSVPLLCFLIYLIKTENIVTLIRIFPFAIIYFSFLLVISYAINRIYMVILYVYAKTGDLKEKDYQKLVHLAFNSSKPKAHFSNPQ